MRHALLPLALLVPLACGPAGEPLPDSGGAPSGDAQASAAAAGTPLSSDCSRAMPDLSAPPITINVPGDGCRLEVLATTGGNSTFVVRTWISNPGGQTFAGPAHFYRAWDGALLGTTELSEVSSINGYEAPTIEGSSQHFATLENAGGWRLRTFDHDGKEVARTPLVGPRSANPGFATSDDGTFVLTHEFNPSGVSLSFYRFDTHGNVAVGPVTIEHEPFGPIGDPTALVRVAPSGHVLLNFTSSTSGEVTGLWVDRDGKVLSERFTIPVGENAASYWLKRQPPVVGGVFFELPQWAFIRDLGTKVEDPPKFVADRPWAWNFNAAPIFVPLPDLRGYLLRTTTPYLEVVAPAGNSCGAFIPPKDGRLTIGRDGSFIVSEGQGGSCRLSLWPRAFR